MTPQQLLAKYKITSVSGLAELLQKASDRYYNTGRPLMADADFDTLFKVLQKRKPDHPFLKQVRAKNVRKKEAKLPYPMPSLNKKHYGEGTLAKWLSQNAGPYDVSDKLDGVSVQLTWSDGEFDGLFIGGDATTGFDWSHMLPHLKLPRKAPTGSGGVRAEIIMSKAEFDSKWANQYKNSRNLTAGITNKVRGVHEAIGSVRLVVFDVLHKRMPPSKAKAWAKQQGFDVVRSAKAATLTEEKLFAYLRKREQTGSHLIDGLVVSVDKAMPLSATNPKHAIAFKAPSLGNYAETEVVEVEWRPTRHGQLQPRLKLKPVKLAGVTVTHATAHNAKYIVDNKINAGSIVAVVRSGEVIPYVEAVVRASRTASKPDVSEVGEYEWDAKRTHYLLSAAEENDTSRIRAISHFFAKGLEVDGFAVGVAQQLHDAGYDTVQKIMKMRVSEFQSLPRWGEKKAEKIYSGIHAAATKANLVKVLAASGAYGKLFGESRLGEIYSKLPHLFEGSAESPRAIRDAVVQLDGFQDTTATAFARAHSKALKFVRSLPLTFAKVKALKVTGSKCRGHVVVFTGVRNAELEQYIKQNGGVVAGSVNAKTTHLVAKDPNSGSSKLNKAQDMGVKVLGLAEYRKLVGAKISI